MKKLLLTLGFLSVLGFSSLATAGVHFSVGVGVPGPYAYGPYPYYGGYYPYGYYPGVYYGGPYYYHHHYWHHHWR